MNRPHSEAACLTNLSKRHNSSTTIAGQAIISEVSCVLSGANLILCMQRLNTPQC